LAGCRIDGDVVKAHVEAQLSTAGAVTITNKARLEEARVFTVALFILQIKLMCYVTLRAAT